MNKVTYQNQNTVATATAISLKKKKNSIYFRRSKDKLGTVIRLLKKKKKTQNETPKFMKHCAQECMYLFFAVKNPGM